MHRQGCRHREFRQHRYRGRDRRMRIGLDEMPHVLGVALRRGRLRFVTTAMVRLMGRHRPQHVGAGETISPEHCHHREGSHRRNGKLPHLASVYLQVGGLRNRYSDRSGGCRRRPRRPRYGRRRGCTAAASRTAARKSQRELTSHSSDLSIPAGLFSVRLQTVSTGRLPSSARASAQVQCTGHQDRPREKACRGRRAPCRDSRYPGRPVPPKLASSPPFMRAIVFRILSVAPRLSSRVAPPRGNAGLACPPRGTPFTR